MIVLRSRAMQRLLVAAVLVLPYVVPQQASAFFCTLAECDPARNTCPAPTPTQVWMQRCIPYYISSAGTLLDSQAREQLVIQSFAVWSKEACTDIEFRYMGRTTETEAWDPTQPRINKNVIASIEDGHEGFDEDPRLLALTLTRYAVATGEIFDADIILNTAAQTFDDVSDPLVCRSQTRAFDLRNTLVHEIGHFIGFDHTNVPAATMAASASACETEKRDLGPDDQMAICTVYPKGEDAKTCVQPASYTPSNSDPTAFRSQCDRPAIEEVPGGCSCGVGGPEGASLLALLASAWGLTRLRRRSGHGRA